MPSLSFGTLCIVSQVHPNTHIPLAGTTMALVGTDVAAEALVVVGEMEAELLSGHSPGDDDAVSAGEEHGNSTESEEDRPPPVFTAEECPGLHS